MATSTRTTKRSTGATKAQGRGRSRQVQAKSTEGIGRGKRAGRRANGNGNGHSGSYLRSAERLAGRMKSALAEYASLAGDSLPDGESFAQGRRNIRDFVQDNAMVLGIAGAGIGVLIGAALTGGMRELNQFAQRESFTDETEDEFM